MGVGAYWILTGPFGLFHSAPGPSTASPVASTMGWFDAWNHNDAAGWRAHMAPGGNRDAAIGGATFSDVRCHEVSATATLANVSCTFHEHADPGLQTQSFFDVSLERIPAGPWLITNYGTG